MSHFCGLSELTKRDKAMTDELFRKDAYLRECDAGVTAVEGRGVVVDRTVFYPLGGGQPGDTGSMSWESGAAQVVDTRYGDSGQILHVLADDSPGFYVF